MCCARTHVNEGSTSNRTSLTPREGQVCCLLAHGYTNAEVAKRLEISARTVETHRNSIMAKIGATRRSELVRFAIENDLFPELDHH